MTPEQLVASVQHWHHKFEIAPGVVTPGSYNPTSLWERLDLPKNLSGVRALDIGTSDGFFAREMHKRGASVVCVDYRPKVLSFSVMERLYGHDFDHRHINIYDIDARDFGTFDIVLFLGVLYHLPDMPCALRIVRSVCRGSVYIESHCDNEFCPDYPAARYFKDDTLANDWTNFWSPNRLCVLDMLSDTGFQTARDELFGDRIFVKADAASSRFPKMETAYGLLP